MTKKKVIYILLVFMFVSPSSHYVSAQSAEAYNVHIEKLSDGNLQLENIEAGKISFNEEEVKPDVLDKTEEKNWFLSFLESKIAPAIISAFISATITIIMFLVGRKIAKNQLIFDIALKNLLPSVYLPIIKELKKYENNNKQLDFSTIEKTIIENYATILFAPKKTKGLLLDIHSICKKIRDEDTYNSYKDELLEKLKELERKIIERFGALIG